MLKPELIAKIADDAEFPRYLAGQTMTALTDDHRSPFNGREVVIGKGLGSFSVKPVPERRVRNPQTGTCNLSRLTSASYSGRKTP